MKKISVFASGGGSNLQSIIDASEKGMLNAEVALVISNNSSAFALERARKHGIKAIHFSTKTHPDPAIYTQELIKLHSDMKIDLVLLAGYMKLLPKPFIALYSGRILNIHPSLLPKHGGKGMYGHFVHEAVIAAKDKESGVTIHWVTEEYDEGPIMMQRSIPINHDDTPDTLAARVLKVEHAVYPEAAALVLSGQIRFPNRFTEK
ncbi:MAG: phosphoribosylglycinamide formyltransferase [Fibrobacteres bacterium]|nr:phosphoribosylglycinamide formyltransferase [Fibrobacterota bacterium]